MRSSESEPWELSIAAAGDLIRRRRISSEEYTRSLLDRMAEFDGQLDAFVTVIADTALDQARAADSEIARGQYRGPLHGVPYAAKDIFDTAGILTSGCSRCCIDRVPRRDATAVRLLREAGAVLIGKLATHEFAHGGPSFDLPWPPARNPWDTARYTGGSSSGAGAALAARFVPLAVGSDTGGSIRGPASWCGVTGLMPTFGLVGRGGMIPNSFTFDRCGPMARSAADCAISLQALAAFDPLDPGSIHASGPDYRMALTGDDLRGLRIGVLEHLAQEEQSAHPEALDALEEALHILRGLGAQVGTARWPARRECVDVKVIIAESEIFSIHRSALRSRAGDFGWDFLQRALPACLFSATDYVAALREHRRLGAGMAAAFEDFDVLVSIGKGPAPRLDDHDPIGFWKNADPFVVANIHGGPAIVFCNGFSTSGLPLGMQVIGRPFADATVLRVAHAYQQSTDWHLRIPPLDASQARPIMTPRLRPTEAPECPAQLRSFCDEMAERAGLVLGADNKILLHRAAPYAVEMVGRLRKEHEFDAAPMTAYRHKRSARLV